ncbi:MULTISPECIES: hypothetical protein [unclassified Acinetobacter]|uniref:hypothetical protein n=1 Tax=unclassified Acinetobacter TaxID=196816 RepID=UPI0029352992|nr:MULTISPECIES: hypothetical protein [unclassified Acinetobacter]WOE33363.1 hypothetical protein QSG84_16190 [Acinetobacter sp. SAAs470]WOE36891.1 hypothetical protein QSG86_00195 [Acinetobacter sp. SAAs474]
MSTTTCYMCNAEATTVEHVPPKCLFPENKDLAVEEKSLDFRKQLITVPSCDEHNGKKSKDDEYLFCLLAISILSGFRGQQQARTKVQRILDFKKSLKDEFNKNSQVVYVQDNESKEIVKTLALTIQRDRIESSLDSCARALYFKEFGNQFVGNIQIIPLFLSDLDPKYNGLSESFSNNTKELFSRIQAKGENSTVFTYKFFVEEGMGKILLEMNFYEDARAIAIFKP